MGNIWERFEYIRTINTGGTALVYVAIDKISGYPVAIKELNSNYFNSDLMRTKFRDEANRYLYLEHKSIVSLYDFYDYGEKQYLVMEYLYGLTVSQYLKNLKSPMPYPMAASIMIQIAEALHYAHSEGWIHLDIKPSNVMLTQDFKVVLIDFGIAHEAITGELGRPMGTPGYMSPEQIKGLKIGRTSDIFSCGMMLYELVTSRLPFDNAASNEEIFEYTIKNEVPDFKAYYSSDVYKTKQMLSIIRKATEKKAEHRYQNCILFCEDLNKIIID